MSCHLFLEHELEHKIVYQVKTKVRLSQLLKFGHNHLKASPAGGWSSFNQISRNPRRAFKPACSYTLAGDGLSFFDFIHGHRLQLGIGALPLVTFRFLSV